VESAVSNDLKIYANALFVINGTTLTQETSVQVKLNSGLNPVYTVALGFAGMSIGAATAELTIENALPSDDFEFNPNPFMRTGTVVECGVITAGRQFTSKGFITEANLSHSVNEAAKLSMTVLTRFADFE
jgi:hypothetical protein